MPVAAIRAAVLDWFADHKRDFPWRGGREPYAVWVAEVMLQQTRTTVVEDFYEAFLARFPTMATLAAAPLDEVLAVWQGLGYYGRARQLHRAARIVSAAYGGALPRTRRQLAELPGVGRYTAGAVASIAFGECVPAVDGNVRRLLARLMAAEGPADKPPASRAIAALSESLALGPRPGDLNQGLMDLGSCVCRPRAPRCGTCPVSRHCRARALGRERTLPMRARRPYRRLAHVWAYVIAELDDGPVLVARRREGGLLGGLWEFPMVEAASGQDAAATLHGTLGLRVADLELLPPVHHDFTHRRLTVTPARGTCGDSAPPNNDRYSELRRVSWRDISGLPRSRLMEKLVAATRPTEAGPAGHVGDGVPRDRAADGRGRIPGP